MALNCLVNKVGFYNGCGTRPNKLLLNDLYGFNLDMAEYISDKDKQTGEDVLNAAIKAASEKVEDDVRSFLTPGAMVFDTYSNRHVGTVADNLKVKTAESGVLKGIRLELSRAPFFSLYINRINFFPAESGTGAIKVYNLLTGAELDSFNITFTAGEICSVEVDKEYRFDGQPIDVIIVAPSVDVYRVNMWDGGDCNKCQGRFINPYLFGNSIKVNNASPKIQSSLRTEVHTGGLWLNYSLRCDVADYICGMSTGLMRAVWYAAGIEVMNEIIFSQRLNNITTVGKDDAIELKNQYVEEYNTIMQRVVDTSKLPNNPCFLCKPTVTNYNAIP